MRVCAFLLITISAAAWCDDVARLVAAKGDVKVGNRVAQSGDTVPAGATIKTEADGSAKLLLADKSVVDLGKQTSFTVLDSVPDSGSSTQLDYGTVRSSIRKKMEKKIKFQMRTKTSVLAVRGTEFIVRSSAGKGGKVADQVTVRDGQVAVGIGGKARVLGAGQQFTALGQSIGDKVRVDPSAVKVVRLGKEALQTLTAQATVDDDTFRQHVEVGEDGKNRTGGSTLGVAVAAVANDTTPDRDRKRDPSRQRPMDPGSIPPLNGIDGGAAQDRIVNGARVRVIFRP